jgi:hypothetical protein
MGEADAARELDGSPAMQAPGSTTRKASTSLVSAAPLPQQRDGKDHINRIFAKTGARDRAQAVRYAYQHLLAAG